MTLTCEPPFKPYSAVYVAHLHVDFGDRVDDRRAAEAAAAAAVTTVDAVDIDRLSLAALNDSAQAS